MKHKFLTVLLALVAAFCLCFGLAACGEKTSPQDPSISAPSGQEDTENNQDADEEGEEKEPEGDEETNPEEGGGNPDEGGGNPDEGGGGQTCVHEYTAENKCKFCGDEWEHTPFEVFVFTPVTLNGIEGYDACFGQSPAASDETGSVAFEGDEIVFPYGYNGLPVISIGRFQSCTSDTVKTITVPKSIRSWGKAGGKGAFTCEALETLNLPDGLPLPMLEQFYKYGPPTETRIYQLSASALFGSSRSAYVCPLWNDPQFRENGVLYIGNYLVDAYFEEPVETFTVRNGTKAVLGCYGAENVILPDSVETIGANAFNVMYSGWWNSGADQPILLKSIDLGEGVKVIGDGAFGICFELTSITIPASVIKIGEQAFRDCSGLTSIIILNDVTEIGAEAFCGCTGLTSIEIPDSVAKIGVAAFGYCTGLTTIEIPGSVKEIGRGAFYDCTGLTEIILREGVTVIGESAFEGCTGLKHVEIPGSVKKIEYLFHRCTELESVTLGNGVTEIGDMAFSLCSTLKSINIPNSVKKIGVQAFSWCIGLTNIEIPDGVTEIGLGAFSECTGLTTIEIPDSVISIGNWAFRGCTGLTSVTIGSGVTSIGEGIFRGCSELTDIQFKGTVEAWKTLEKGENWDADTGDYTVTCTNGTVDKEGNVTYFGN